MRAFNITVNGKVYAVQVEEAGAAVSAYTAPPVVSVSAPAPVPVTDTPAPAAVSAAVNVAAGAETVKSPMPGTILQVNCAPGKSVKKGEVLFILEAMKMENEILAARDGVIDAVPVSKGATVNTGDILAVLK